MGYGLYYVLGALVLSVGLVLLGLATFGPRTLPFWSGPALIAGLAGLWVLGNTWGWLSCDLVWLAVGHALRTTGAAGYDFPRVM